MAVRVKIEGLDEIKETLRQVTNSQNAVIQERILKRRAKPLIARMKALAPKRTGTLRRSIKSEVEKEVESGQQAFAIARNTGATTTEARAAAKTAGRSGNVSVTLVVGPTSGKDAKEDAWYAHFVEFGTANMSAKPFMRPAWDSQKRGIFDGIAKDVWSEVQKVLSKKKVR